MTASTIPAPTARATAHPSYLRSAVVILALALLGASVLLVAPGRADAAITHARTVQEKAAISKVLAQVNAYRKANGRAPLRANSKLANAARAHDYRMAARNTLSHQLPGEADFGKRITAAGYSWRAAAENIGWNSSRTAAGALAVTSAMYHEKAPNDGHRVNMLSRAYVDVGIDVYGDSTHHRLWVTMDFGHH